MMTPPFKYLFLPILVLVTSIACSAMRPNIVFIMADDLGYGDVGCFVDEATIRTPRLDRLASEGLRFSNYHVNALCTPTRAAVFTGQYTFDNYEKGGAPKNGIVQSSRFLSQMLQDAGYATAAFGKWHLAHGEGDHALDRGFDEWIGFYGGGMAFHYDQAKANAAHSKGLHNTIYNGREPYEEEWSHTTDLFTDLAINFIESNKQQPFFLYLSYNAVHTPIWSERNPEFSAREDWLQKQRDRGLTDNMEIDYNALVEHMDERIGDLLDALEANVLAEKTLVIFQSDNGPIRRDSYYAHPESGSAGPYRAGKSTLYEGGIRVPLIMRAGLGKKSQVIDDFAMHADILPTCLEVAGLDIPDLNGKHPLRGHSLYPYLSNQEPEDITRPSFYSIGKNMAVIEGDWKLVNLKQWVGPSRDPHFSEPPTDGFVLYNLEDDPGETNNLAEQYPERVKHLRRLWEDYHQGIGKAFAPSH